MLFDQFSTAWNYGTTPFSQQSTMLTQQDAAFATPAQSGSFGSMTGIVSGIGGIMSAIGAMSAAKAQKQQLKYQADAMDANAAHVRVMSGINTRISELGAESVLSQGQQQVASLTLKTRQLKGAQRAAMAANGINLGVGSAAEVTASTDLMKEIDKNTIEANAVRNAWGYRTQGTAGAIGAEAQATNYEINAMGTRATGDSISPAMAGASSLITSAARVSDAWYRYKKVS